MKKWWLLLLFIFITPLLSGCWDNRPINQRNLILSIGVEPVPGTTRMKFYFTVPEPTGKSSTQGASKKYFTLTSEAPELDQAITRAQSTSSKDLYLGQLQDILLSEHLSPTQTHILFNELARMPQFSKTTWLVITPDPIHRLINLTNPQEHSLPLYLDSVYSCNSCQTTTTGTHLWQFLRALHTPGRDPIVPVIQANKKSSNYHIGALSLFSGDQFAGQFSKDETLGLQYIKNRVNKATILFKSGTNIVSIRSIHGAAKVSFGYNLSRKNTFPQVTIDLREIGTLELDGGYPPPLRQKRLHYVQKRGEKYILQDVLGAIATSQKLGVDPFGIGTRLYANNPDLFTSLGNWHQAWPHIPVLVHVHLRIVQVGTKS